MKKRNSLNISVLFQPNKKVVNLSGFPNPQFEKEIYYDEKKYRKNKSLFLSYFLLIQIKEENQDQGMKKKR